MTISELFKPLSKTEQSALKPAISRLFNNPDFELYLRDAFSKANPLLPSFSDRDSNDSLGAAKREGEKNANRYLLKLFIGKDEPETERPTEQL